MMQYWKFLMLRMTACLFVLSAYGNPSLIERNPFLNHSFKPEVDKPLTFESTPDLMDQLSFLGTYLFHEERKFSIQSLSDTKKKGWYTINEWVQGYEIMNYLEPERLLVLKKGDTLGYLPISSSKEVRERRNHSKNKPLRRPPPIATRHPQALPSKPIFPDVFNRSKRKVTPRQI